MPLLLLAFPVLAMMLLIEFAYGIYKNHNTYADSKDTFASLTLGLMQVGMTALFYSAALAVDFFLYEHRLFDMGHSWQAVLLLFILIDFSFYWWHRASHRVRFLWANHVNHHSSKQYNFSTALRQPVFSPLFRPFFFLYIPVLGFDPVLIGTVGVISLVFGVLTHTKHVSELGLLEWIFVTPSSHRVHHGSNAEYIDKNYGGILIIWDRLFGTYQREKSPVRYGLTRNVETYHLITLTLHEWVAWVKDLRRSRSLREMYDHTFNPPR